MLARDSTSTWTRATRSATPERGGGAPGRSLSRATRSSCRFSPCGGARNSSLSSQSIVGELEPRRPVGEEAEEEGLEELLEQHLEALVVIRTGRLRHDRLPVGPNPEGRDRRVNPQAVRERDETPCYQDERFRVARFLSMVQSSGPSARPRGGTRTEGGAAVSSRRFRAMSPLSPALSSRPDRPDPIGVPAGTVRRAGGGPAGRKRAKRAGAGRADRKNKCNRSVPSLAQ